MGGERVAVVTIVHGRHEHLERLLWGLGRQTRRPDVLVVVAMDDPEVERILQDDRLREPGDGPAREVVCVATGRVGGSLPLAAARNLGVDTAEAAGTSHLVLLDVDCIPSPGLVERYTSLLVRPEAPRLEVLAGEVAYLPPPPEGRDYRELDLDALSAPHSGRPTLEADEMLVADDLRLFWSLSFATTTTTWRAVGGFDPAYVGYGGEDTDFGQRLAAAGATLTWAGGARAHHQHHPTQDPPTQHLHDIVSNANRFARRWGWWPMESWLDAFSRAGLVGRRPDGVWVVR